MWRIKQIEICENPPHPKNQRSIFIVLLPNERQISRVVLLALDSDFSAAYEIDTLRWIASLNSQGNR